MPLTENTKAPDFSLPSTGGATFKLSEHAAGKTCILYFYPKDFTPGCTAQACEFRDSFALFRELDVPVYGISRDSLKTHERFKQEHRLPFDLLADEEGKVAKLYKASIPLMGVNRRITYLLNPERLIVAVYENMFAAEKHIKEMIKRVKASAQ